MNSGGCTVKSADMARIQPTVEKTTDNAIFIVGIPLGTYWNSIEILSREVTAFHLESYPSVSISTLGFDVSKRAYGKPAVKEEKEIVDLPPVVIQLT